MSLLKTDPPIIVEHIFADSTPEQLWNALTNHPDMIKWYFPQIPSFEPNLGFKTEFVVKNEGRTFTHQWEVTEAKANRKISYRWTFPEYQGDSISRFEILQHGDGAKLILSCIVEKDFPSDVPEFQRASCEGGWNYFIKDALAKYMQSL